MKHIKNLLKSFFDHYRGLSPIVFLVRVEGESLWPALIPGRRYIASSLGAVMAGDLAVFRNPKDERQIFVKRVARESKDGYIMESAVSWGLSSRDFGPVDRRFIVGKILLWKNE